MPRRQLYSLLVVAFSISTQVLGQENAARNAARNGGDFSESPQVVTKAPKGGILVKGAWSTASDSVTPVPEDGSVTNNTFINKYFGMNYPLLPAWEEKYKGPPPSDSGRYVLAQLRPDDTFKGPARASVLITAQDMFFTPLPARNALDLVNYSKNKLQADYKIEMQPTPTRIADHPFIFFAYWSPVAELHWYVLSTQIRCHAVEMVLTSRDTKFLESLVLDLNKMKLPAEAGPTAGTGGGDVPVCIKDYAKDENLISRVDPQLTEHRFNPAPVRIIIDKEGRVKHIHFLSAFPDQAKAIGDALKQWRFKRYLKDGKPVEVETGLMFGREVHRVTLRAAEQTTE